MVQCDRVENQPCDPVFDAAHVVDAMRKQFECRAVRHRPTAVRFSEDWVLVFSLATYPDVIPAAAGIQ